MHIMYIGGSSPIQLVIPDGSSQLTISPLDLRGICDPLRVLVVDLLSV